ncbi:MAG: hypothetical protein MUD08_06945 [Cytophagales bacterium]|jgi:hypothetical protein|nr:hypothetical protein [Cytophagales bacterium]
MKALKERDAPAPGIARWNRQPMRFKQKLSNPAIACPDPPATHPAWSVAGTPKTAAFSYSFILSFTIHSL